MRLWFILGTAAELIKVFPLIKLSIDRGFEVKVIATGQSHSNFLRQYEDFRLADDILLWLVKKGADLETSISALQWLTRVGFTGRRVFRKLVSEGAPDFVIVHGDTLSCLVGAILARSAKLRVVHIEAGLRSQNWFHPFPEEIIRRMVAKWTSIHFAPDNRAKDNLTRSGFRSHVYDTRGNTLQDAVRWGLQMRPEMNLEFDGLVNIHRFENLNSKDLWHKTIGFICEAAKRWRLVFVLHPQTDYKLGQDAKSYDRLRQAGVVFLPRVSFTGFMALLSRARFMITDGGSNQEESYYLGKPCLILRQATERSEGLGANALLSRFDDKLVAEFLLHPEAFKREQGFQDQQPTDFILETLSRELE